MKPRYFDDSRRWGSDADLDEHKRGFYRLRGSVATRNGYVVVFALTSGRIPARDDPDDTPAKKWGPVTRLYLILNGKQHMRDYPRILSRLSAVRAAHRFAREVAA